jgi:hypothetical protein
MIIAEFAGWGGRAVGTGGKGLEANPAFVTRRVTAGADNSYRWDVVAKVKPPQRIKDKENSDAGTKS